MTFEDGKPKGMKQVLIERGLWKNSLLADCKLCKDKVIDENRIVVLAGSYHYNLILLTRNLHWKR
jgi:hypothetical protein